MATVDIQFNANALQAALTNGAPLTIVEGDNVDVYVRAFDYTTEEYVLGKFVVPSNVVAGSVVFSSAVIMETPASGEVARQRFSHIALEDGEDFDVAYANELLGATALNYTVDQDDITIMEWSETIANLGWQAGDLILFKVSRPYSIESPDIGDLYLLHFTIKIPV